MEIIGIREEGVPTGSVETHANNFPDCRKGLAPMEIRPVGRTFLKVFGLHRHVMPGRCHRLAEK
jgi:hypothetical protein